MNTATNSYTTLFLLSSDNSSYWKEFQSNKLHALREAFLTEVYKLLNFYLTIPVQWSRNMKKIGGPMCRANSHECLFAFIDFTVKIKRLINCKVIYNRYKYHWKKIREIF